jgi:hypothetical protein
MTEAQQKNKLMQALRDILSGDIHLSASVVHYMDSTLAVTSGEELAHALSDPDNCEAETAIELIFFPDEAIQEKLEPILSEIRLTEADVSEIVRYLSQQNLQARLCFPDLRGQAILPVPDAAIHKMAARLRMTRSIPGQMADAIDATLPDTHSANLTRVKLRNARIAQSANQIDFLCKLIRGLGQQLEDFWQLLDLAIDLLEQTEPQADMYDALMAHKQFLIKTIRAAEKNQQALASNTVEALIMKGINVSAIDVGAAREKIDQIDRISIAVYGRTEFLSALAPAGQSIDLSVQDKDDMAAIRRLLS